MERIIENRQILVRNKVVSIANIQAIARFMSAEVERHSSAEKEKIELRLVARCDDGSSFQSEGLEIFGDDSRVWQRRVVQVSAAYSFYPTRAQMEVSLRHGASDATVTVSGMDRNWVSGTVESLAGLLDSFPQQNNLYTRHRSLVEFVIAMGIGSILSFVLGLLPFDPPSDESLQRTAWIRETLSQFPAVQLLVKYGVTWMLGWPWTWGAAEKLQRLWPSIELQLGPDHLLEEKQRRKALGAVLLLGFLPLSLSLLYDLLKYWTGH